MNRSLAVVVVAFAGSAAVADVANFQGVPALSTEGTGAVFFGSMDYDSANGRLLLAITNDTPVSVGGFLTGVVFRVNGDADADLVFTPIAAFEDTGTGSAQPFGTFDAGVAVGGNWEGGGNPSQGLAIGDSAVFEFLVTGADAASLLAGDFLGAPGEIGLVARFRGLADGGSDKVPTPAPAAAALLGVSGLVATRRRR